MSASIGLTRPAFVAGRILPERAPHLASRSTLAGDGAFIGHGQNDTKLTTVWAHRADAWLTELGVPHETHLYPSDHGIPHAMQQDFVAWFGRLVSGETPVLCRSSPP